MCLKLILKVWLTTQFYERTVMLPTQKTSATAETQPVRLSNNILSTSKVKVFVLFFFQYFWTILWYRKKEYMNINNLCLCDIGKHWLLTMTAILILEIS